MYGKSCYKIYVIHVKIRNIRKIRISWYCYEWLLLTIYDGLFFIKNDTDVASIKTFRKEVINREDYLRPCRKDVERECIHLLKTMVATTIWLADYLVTFFWIANPCGFQIRMWNHDFLYFINHTYTKYNCVSLLKLSITYSYSTGILLK